MIGAKPFILAAWIAGEWLVSWLSHGGPRLLVLRQLTVLAYRRRPPDDERGLSRELRGAALLPWRGEVQRGRFRVMTPDATDSGSEADGYRCSLLKSDVVRNLSQHIGVNDKTSRGSRTPHSSCVLRDDSGVLLERRRLWVASRRRENTTEEP